MSILFWWMKATLYWNNDLWIIKILISKKKKPIQYKKLKTYKFNLILCFLIFLMFRDNNLNKEYSSFSSDLSPSLSTYISDHTVFPSPPFREIRWKLFRVTRGHAFRKFIGRRIGLLVYRVGTNWEKDRGMKVKGH